MLLSPYSEINSGKELSVRREATIPASYTIGEGVKKASCLGESSLRTDVGV